MIVPPGFPKDGLYIVPEYIGCFTVMPKTAKLKNDHVTINTSAVDVADIDAIKETIRRSLLKTGIRGS